MRSRFRAAVALAALAGLALVLSLVAGCSPRHNPVGDVPPTTRLFINGAVDPVNHVVHLYWFGSDVDGDVVFFEWRLFNSAQTAPDTTWHKTYNTDSLFTIFTGDSALVHPVFEVRAVDNAGLRDPHPARQNFQFTNQPPIVTLLVKPAVNDTTFASLTLSWTGFDIDGDITKAYYLVWLDGNEASKHVVTANTFTIPTADFVTNGQIRTGVRTVYVQPVDDGGMAGAVASATWNVRPAVTGTRARLLILDDIPSTTADPARVRTDTLYSNSALRNMSPTEYTIVRLRPASGVVPPPFSAPPFRSAKDVEQTFKLFEAVLWYRGAAVGTASSQVWKYVDGIGPYLASGGTLYVEGLDMLSGHNAIGPLNADFQSSYLDINHLASWFDSITFMDSTAAWSAASGKVWYSTTLADSLGTLKTPNAGVRGAIVNNASSIGFSAPAGALLPANPIPLTVGTLVQQPSGGWLYVQTSPMSLCNRFGNAARVVAKIWGKMGMIPSVQN